MFASKGYQENIKVMKDLGVLVFGHTRAMLLGDLLESLRKQDALHYVDLWVDGYQGIWDLRKKVERTQKVANNFSVGVRRYHRGGLGFRKIMLQALQSAVHNYKNIIANWGNDNQSHNFSFQNDTIFNWIETPFLSEFLWVTKKSICFTRSCGQNCIYGLTFSTDKEKPFLNVIKI